MSAQSISVLGCGWLGFPLAQHLCSIGYKVKGSTTQNKKLADLKHAGIAPYLIESTPEIVGEHVQDFFDADILFLNIPFRRNLKDPKVYKTQIQSIIKQVESSPIALIVFASSTSIYPENQPLCEENLHIIPQNERAKVLFDVEVSLFRNNFFQSTILRFGGLYGGSRKIGKYLAGKENVGNGPSPANLVHLDDCIEISTRIIQKKIQGEIFNICSDKHPTRQELYTHAAKSMGLPVPTFNDEPTNRLKIVSNQKVKKRLDYDFVHPDPMTL